MNRFFHFRFNGSLIFVAIARPSCQAFTTPLLTVALLISCEFGGVELAHADPSEHPTTLGQTVDQVDAPNPEDGQPAAQQQSDPQQDAIGSVHDLPVAGLSDELEDLTERCVPLHRLKKMEAISEFHVIVTMKDKSKFLVQFDQCPGLRAKASLSYSTNGTRLCRLDALRPITGLGPASTVGPPCQIPGFEPVSDEQIEFVMAEYISWKAAQRR